MISMESEAPTAARGPSQAARGRASESADRVSELTRMIVYYWQQDEAKSSGPRADQKVELQRYSDWVMRLGSHAWLVEGVVHSSLPSDLTESKYEIVHASEHLLNYDQLTEELEAYAESEGTPLGPLLSAAAGHFDSLRPQPRQDALSEDEIQNLIDDDERALNG